MVYLDIGRLYPELFHHRWALLDHTNSTLAREAWKFRQILSTFTRLKFLRVSYALLIGLLEEETKGFGDMLTQLLPPSVERFEVAVFNHGTDTWIENPNNDWSVKCFFQGLGQWTDELGQEKYLQHEFCLTYRHLRKFSIVVQNKGNNSSSIYGGKFWRDRRRVNLDRLRSC